MRTYVCDKVDDSWIDTAPVRLVNTIDIEATPEHIWSALEDAAAWPRWATVITHVEWTSPQPFGIGTTRTVTMRGGLIGYEEFISWEPYTRLGFRFNEATTSGVRAFAERYTLERMPDGKTRVVWVMAMAPKGVSSAIVPLTRIPMRLAFGRMLRRFGRLVESEYRISAAE
jgi:Polyketide cyclase / dehydrase and lipid transport